MSSQATNHPQPQELDVRGMRKPDKHPAIFAAYAALPVDGALVLVNDHDPQHLREEFEVDHIGSFEWTYLNRQMRDWRVQITKLANTPLPRVLVDTTTIATGADDDRTVAEAAGAVWRLDVRERDLDSNIITLPPGEAIDTHTGPDLDVLIHVVGGGGTLTTERHTIDLVPGHLLWLPRRSRRRFKAGAEGLRYLTVHQRRQSLVLDISRAG